MLDSRRSSFAAKSHTHRAHPHLTHTRLVRRAGPGGHARHDGARLRDVLQRGHAQAVVQREDRRHQQRVGQVLRHRPQELEQRRRRREHPAQVERQAELHGRQLQRQLVRAVRASGSRSSRSFQIKVNATTLWRDTKSIPKYDKWVRSTTTHELGHALSLADNPNTSKVSLMKHSRDRSKVQTPQPYDKSEVKRIYK